MTVSPSSVARRALSQASNDEEDCEDASASASASASGSKSSDESGSKTDGDHSGTDSTGNTGHDGDNNGHDNGDKPKKKCHKKSASESASGSRSSSGEGVDSDTSSRDASGSGKDSGSGSGSGSVSAQPPGDSDTSSNSGSESHDSDTSSHSGSESRDSDTSSRSGSESGKSDTSADSGSETGSETGSENGSDSESEGCKPSTHVPDGDLRSCETLFTGETDTCSSECADNFQVLLNEAGCCSTCLIHGFNATLNFTLPPLDVCLNRLELCANVTVSVLNQCSRSTRALQQTLTIENLRFSFVNSSLLDEFMDDVRASVAEAAGIPVDEVSVTGVIDGTTGTKFTYLLDTDSDALNALAGEFVQSASTQSLLNLTSIDFLAYVDLPAAVYNTSTGFSTDVTHAA